MRRGPTRMDYLFKISQHRYGSLHQSGEVRRRQGIGGDPTRKGWRRLAGNHLKRGDKKQNTSNDRSTGCDCDYREEKYDDAEGVLTQIAH